MSRISQDQETVESTAKLLQKDFVQLRLSADVADAAPDDDLTAWETLTSLGAIDVAAGVVTLKPDRIYELFLALSTGEYSDATAGFAMYDLVLSADNSQLVSGIRAVYWPPTFTGSHRPGYSGVLRLIYKTDSSEVKVKVRCTMGTGTHQVQSDNSQFIIYDLGPTPD